MVPGDRDSISELCAHNLAERRMRQPLSLASAGSVFKNPSPEQPAGKLLEEAGLKGERLGGAQVSELHANWIVNPEKTAKASDILSLIALCQARVKARSGIELTPEVRMWL
jgi:UDP-N-acetylmuramate dehydrogenase